MDSVLRQPNQKPLALPNIYIHKEVIFLVVATLMATEV